MRDTGKVEDVVMRIQAVMPAERKRWNTGVVTMMKEINNESDYDKIGVEEEAHDQVIVTNSMGMIFDTR